MIVYILGGIMLGWIWIQLMPVSALTYLDSREWDEQPERWLNVKRLDVRDANEYWEDHIPESINISVGRLPIMWRKDLSPDDEVVILSRTWLQRKKAARILARRGFHRLYAVKGCYLPLKQEGGQYEHKCSY